MSVDNFRAVPSHPRRLSADFEFGQEYNVVLDEGRRVYLIDDADGCSVASAPLEFGAGRGRGPTSASPFSSPDGRPRIRGEVTTSDHAADSPPLALAILLTLEMIKAETVMSETQSRV